jgi:hypothetical protein
LNFIEPGKPRLIGMAAIAILLQNLMDLRRRLDLGRGRPRWDARMHALNNGKNHNNRDDKLPQKLQCFLFLCFQEMTAHAGAASRSHRGSILVDAAQRRLYPHDLRNRPREFYSLSSKKTEGAARNA